MNGKAVHGQRVAAILGILLKNRGMMNRETRSHEYYTHGHEYCETRGHEYNQRTQSRGTNEGD